MLELEGLMSTPNAPFMNSAISIVGIRSNTMNQLSFTFLAVLAVRVNSSELYK